MHVNHWPHLIHDTESISSLAALYNSSLLTQFCLLSINVGSSSNNSASCLPCFLPTWI
uniref:Uncharacterized protein n=1 Tax=Rhizophora mucronata TaxID=61149 RepID=A0A2P2J3C9_RHIMU